MLEFELGCYKSYPLTGISSRDCGLASKEIRIGLEFKKWGVTTPTPLQESRPEILGWLAKRSG